MNFEELRVREIRAVVRYKTDSEKWVAKDRTCKKSSFHGAVFNRRGERALQFFRHILFQQGI